MQRHAGRHARRRRAASDAATERRHGRLDLQRRQQRHAVPGGRPDRDRDLHRHDRRRPGRHGRPVVTVTVTGTNDDADDHGGADRAIGAVTEDANAPTSDRHRHDRVQRHRPDRRAHDERGPERQHAGRHADAGVSERQRRRRPARSAGPTASPTAPRSTWPTARPRPRRSPSRSTTATAARSTSW